jgi:glycylpeptide N-tetradecanoyltransferase
MCLYVLLLKKILNTIHYNINIMDLKNLSKKQIERLVTYMEKTKSNENVENFKITPPKTLDEAKQWKYDFWTDKPVQMLDTNASSSKPFVDNLNEPTEPYRMKNPYEWVDFDINNEEHMTSVATFLQKYYVEDSKSMFRLHYSKEFLKWAVGDTGFIFGIKSKNTGILGGIVAGVPGTYQIFDKVARVGEVNFLCCHPSLRNKGIAELMIQEVTRRHTLNGIHSGFFTTDRFIPTPVAQVQYYHRALNLGNLLDTKYIAIEGSANRETAVSINAIGYPVDESYVKMETDEHYQKAFELYNEYIQKYNFYQVFTFDGFKHRFANSSIVSSYIINDENNIPVDFLSYYKLPSYVLDSVKNKKIPQFVNNAYMLMYTSTTTTPLSLFRNAFALANAEKMDVFTASNIMENDDVFTSGTSKFLQGSGQLYYNFYNWSCPEMLGPQISKVTL